MHNTYFSSVCSQDNGDIPNVAPRVTNGVHIDTVNFNRNAIITAINKLKSNLASGPDGFPPLLFKVKRLCTCLAEPLSMMFNSFFSIHQVPREWSKAIVTPVFKSGSSCDVANNRPISLTCVACKLMERVVATRVLDYLRMQNLISKHQHGLLSRQSTVSNLLQGIC